MMCARQWVEYDLFPLSVTIFEALLCGQLLENLAVWMAWRCVAWA